MKTLLTRKIVADRKSAVLFWRNRMESGYAAVMKLSNEDPGWLPYVSAAYRVAQKQGEYEFTGSDVLDEMQPPAWAPSLKALARWGILAHVRTTRGGKKAWYLMPDREGVGRALAEIGKDSR
jgi:hypothetical protein